MATVWTARQISLDRIVAVKFLSTHLLNDPEAVEQFRSESKAAAQLRHPGIVQIYDAGEYKGLFYYVMEFVAGCTIGDLLKKKGRLEEKHALLVAEGIALALSHAWSASRLIHCDIKPENVLVDSDGTIKVADLGLARIMGRYTVEKEADTISGTPNYISPEQATGLSDLDCRTDIYSLGCMLYHMVTGRLPFAHNAERQILEKQCFDFLPDPAELQTELSLETAWLIEKMMVKDRNLRTADWKEVLADIQTVIAGNLPTLLPPAGRSTVQRGPRREAAPPKKKKTSEAVVLTEDAAPRQKIVLSKKDMKTYLSTSAERQNKPDMAGALTTLAVLSVCVVVSLFGFRCALSPTLETPNARHTIEEQDLPPRAHVVSPEPVTIKPSPARPSAEAKTPSAAPNQALPSWDHPDFQRAARDFNQALALYKQFQTDRKDPSLLQQAEKLSRQAQKTFESLKNRAPADVPIEQTIQQCYHLIADCRHSTLLIPGQATSPKPQGALSAPSAATAQGVSNIVLALNWEAPVQGNSYNLKDLQTLLSDWGSPGVQLAADPSLILFAHISFLMPAPEAARLAGLKLSPRRPVACAGFPRDSFFYYTLRGDFGEGFRELLLVADKADQVVAIQLVNDNPGVSLWLDAQFFTDQWKTYEFIQGKIKSNIEWKIAHRVTPLNHMIRIDSELVQNDPNGYFGLGDSKSRTSLLLPEQMVSLLLHNLQKNGPK
ncbi:MAG TPA: hypothetical protein DCZ95_07900 [Verrucomicrobia bacterium]|nr:MAG: hypothetical protein A2X46_14740 [Lentisphaerae bacterium GWF2_57_35]HBA83999.1 hypothetical protein [Verrucomicrobiota bacterium]